MNSIRLYSLYSGSEGNAFLIATDRGCILIDAGKSCRSLCAAIRACGHEPEEIRAVFVTHEHTDHIKALPVFLKKYPVEVHLPISCAYKLENEPSAVPHLRPHPPIHTERVEGITVTSFPTPHDSRGSVGYRVEIPTEEGTLRLGYATDIGHVSREVEEHLMGCDAVVLESNHDTEMLRTGPYPYELKLRVGSKRGHLSNTESAAFAARLCEAGTKSILLAHLSRENNTPDTAFDECYCCVAHQGVRLAVASPDTVTELTTEGAYPC